MKKQLFVLLQHLLPQHLLSRCAGHLADCRWKIIKSTLIALFIKRFNVDLREAEIENPQDYDTFNHFFCRALKPGARPIVTGAKQIGSPADGTVSQMGVISKGRIFQAKARDYSVEELLGGSDWSSDFINGLFATIYLSPKDYHRLHMPIDGHLLGMRHIPGKLFSVNPATTEKVNKLFARNERLVCIFDTQVGPMAMVLIGAMVVASIDTSWAGEVAPTGKNISTYHYHEQQAISLQKGEEMGRFKLGSTVIILFPDKALEWLASLGENSAVRMGEPIAQIMTP